MDKVVNAVKRSRADMWGTFIKSLQITGYRYYEPPAEIKYRYPAPGSAPLDYEDHHNLYKNDWKTPFRTSEYNIQAIEQTLRDDDPLQAENYVSNIPTWDPSDPQKGMYDQLQLNEAIPKLKSTVLYGEHAITSDEMRNELWAGFEAQEQEMIALRRDFGPGQQEYNDDYNQVNLSWRNRGATGMENSPRMKEIFVELEYWIEEVYGKKRIVEGGNIKPYKGQPKKWQILDDSVYSREQVEKLQAATDAPMPEQLEMWKEKHDTTLYGIANNANVQAWRDDPRFNDSADFDPALLVSDKETKQRLFLERYEKPKELTE